MATNRLKFRRKNTTVVHLRASDTVFHDGDTLYMTVKQVPDGDETDNLAVISESWVYGTDVETDENGYINLTLDAGTTDIEYGIYHYDIKLVTADEPSISQTLAYGHLEVLPVTTLRA